MCVVGLSAGETCDPVSAGHRSVRAAFLPDRVSEFRISKMLPILGAAKLARRSLAVFGQHRDIALEA